MKSIVNNSTQKPEIKFPKLMIHPTTKAIILATKFGDGSDFNRPYGILLSNDGSKYPVGEISLWSSEFKDFDGSVTISND